MKPVRSFSSQWLLLTVLGWGALSPVDAWADVRGDARRHFRAGMALISEKQYDEAIAELQQAYAIKPHPNVLFNIARAHEAAGRLPEAIEFYQKYLEANPPDEEDVQKRADRLVALLPKVNDSKPVVVPRPADGAGSTLDTGKAESARPDDAKKIAELTAQLEAANAQLKKEPTLPKATKAESVDGLSDGELRLEETKEETDFGVPYEETVAAASRRVQSTLVAPNSVTVISGDEIRATGLRSVPEILRRVPGAEVMSMGVASENVSFRGFNQRTSNKILVLIDGRPEYLDNLGSTLYSLLPISVEDIDRIEVIRGPGSALYGANAMTGVVNILTRAPGAGSPAEVKAVVGTGSTVGAYGSASGGKRFKYRASVGFDQAAKYSLDYAVGRSDVASNQVDPNLSLRSARGNASLFYAFNKSNSVTLSGGLSRTFGEFYPPGTLRNFNTDGIAGFARADISLGPIKTRFFWNHFNALVFPQFEPVGQRSLKNTIDSNVFDLELLFQKDFSLGGTHQFTAGVSGRLKRVGWTFIGPLVQELLGAVFVQDEWQVFRPVRLVGSLRVDRHPLLNNGSPGVAVSPRLALVVNPVEQHAFRASFSTAFRQPTFLESYLSLVTPIPGLNGASILSQGNRKLRPERLLGGELGYRGELATSGVTVDAAAYWYVVSDLTRLSAVTRSPASTPFDSQTNSFIFGRSGFANDPAQLNARGLELSLVWNALSGVDLKANVAVQSIQSASAGSCPSCAQAPTAKVNVGFVYRAPFKLELSSDFNYTSNSVWIEREPNASDPTQIAELSNPLEGFAVVNARIGYRFFGDHFSLAVVGTQLAAPHQEHPFGNWISRRFFLELGGKL